MHGTINIGAESYVEFNLVHAYSGGAIVLFNGALNIDGNVNLKFSHNCGGAVHLNNGELIVHTYANLNFSNNFAVVFGGAVFVLISTIYVNTSSIHFCNNRATWGHRCLQAWTYQGNARVGDASRISDLSFTIVENSLSRHLEDYLLSMPGHTSFSTGAIAWGRAIKFHYSTMCMYINSSLKFIANTAGIGSGAVYIESGVSSSILENSSKVLSVFNNSAFQGGALYSYHIIIIFNHC